MNRVNKISLVVLFVLNFLIVGCASNPLVGSHYRPSNLVGNGQEMCPSGHPIPKSDPFCQRTIDAENDMKPYVKEAVKKHRIRQQSATPVYIVN